MSQIQTRRDMNQIQTTQEFQQRVFEKIRADIGNLLTEKELKALVDTAMQKAFFEDRQVQDGYHTRTEPPYFMELTSQLMQSQVRAAIDQWLANHKDEVSKLLEEALAKGILKLAADYIQNTVMAGPLYDLRESLVQKGLMKPENFSSYHTPQY